MYTAHMERFQRVFYLISTRDGGRDFTIHAVCVFFFHTSYTAYTYCNIIKEITKNANNSVARSEQCKIHVQFFLSKKTKEKKLRIGGDCSSARTISNSQTAGGQAVNDVTIRL